MKQVKEILKYITEKKTDTTKKNTSLLSTKYFTKKDGDKERCYTKTIFQIKKKYVREINPKELVFLAKNVGLEHHIKIEIYGASIEIIVDNAKLDEFHNAFLK